MSDVEIRSINALRADRENDNTLLSPIEAIEDAAMDLRTGKIECDKALVLMLDAKDGQYNLRFTSSNLRVSEMVSLLEAMKARCIKMLVP
jgi:hypothetical protein